MSIALESVDPVDLEEFKRVMGESMTLELFVANTTSSIKILCFSRSWRNGSSDYREPIDRHLAALAVAEESNDIGGLDRTLGELGIAAMQGMRDSNTSFSEVCGEIRGMSNDLKDMLKATPEYEDYLAEQEEESLAPLRAMSWDDRIAAFKDKYGADAIVDALVDGAEDLAGDARCKRLCQNFANIHFVYTMKPNSFANLLRGSAQGDCGTVSAAMEAIVREILLMKANVERCNDLVVTNGNATIDAAKAPNAEGGTFWTFNNHRWVIANGKGYDPLFAAELDQTDWLLIRNTTRFDDLGTALEDFGGDYQLVQLIVAGERVNTRVSQIREDQWEAHCLDQDIDVSFEVMQARFRDS